MSLALKRVASATTVMLAAGLGAFGSAGVAHADDDTFCEGMSAPRNAAAGNHAPVLRDDTARVAAGQSAVIKVLANDSDPDMNKLYVVSVSVPSKGDACIDGNGDLEYFSRSSATNYTQQLTYGVTDGDLYRTATVTVSVEGIKPIRAQLARKKKGNRKAKVTFTNTNTRNLAVFAGSPKKSRPTFSRTVPAGKTVVFATRLRRVEYVVALRGADGEFSLVNVGRINTKNGRSLIATLDGARMTPGTQARANRWIS